MSLSDSRVRAQARVASRVAAPIGQHRERKIVGEMLVDPFVQRAEFVLGRLHRQSLAELRLSARTHRGHHRQARNGVRHRGTVIGADQVQTQVDSRRETGRGDDRAVFDE